MHYALTCLEIINCLVIKFGEVILLESYEDSFFLKIPYPELNISELFWMFEEEFKEKYEIGYYQI